MGELPGEEQGKNGQEFDERAAETFSTSIGEKHTVEEWGKALEEFAEYQCRQDKEERTWQDHIMDRFMRRI